MKRKLECQEQWRHPTRAQEAGEVEAGNKSVNLCRLCRSTRDPGEGNKEQLARLPYFVLTNEGRTLRARVGGTDFSPWAHRGIYNASQGHTPVRTLSTQP